MPAYLVKLRCFVLDDSLSHLQFQISWCRQLLFGTVSLRSTPPQAVPPLTVPRVACVPKRTAEHLADNLVYYYYATRHNRGDAHNKTQMLAEEGTIIDSK